jgi:hypothetical protein
MERGPAREAAPATQPAQTSPSQSSGPDAGTRARKSADKEKVPTAPGIEFPRHFTLPDVDPFDEVEWETRAAVIGNEKGKVVFEQRDVEIPKFWSQQATNIVVSKYFRGQLAQADKGRLSCLGPPATFLGEAWQNNREPAEPSRNGGHLSVSVYSRPYSPRWTHSLKNMTSHPSRREAVRLILADAMTLYGLLPAPEESELNGG